MMDTQRMRIPCFLFADYLLHKPENASQLFVLLHGYGQSAANLYRKLQPLLPPDAIVLAPNGPFPLPRRKEPASDGRAEGYEVGYSWYFYNPQTDEYWVDMEVGVAFLTGLLDRLGFSKIPTTVIGFSQGGYLAPFLASHQTQVQRVIGIACQFLGDELTLPVSLRMDAIHGGRDDIVSAEGSQRAHEKLRNAGIPGEFHLLPESSHRIDGAVQARLKEIL